MDNFKDYYRLIYEMQDSKRNREAVMNAYGLMDNNTPQNAEARASELISKFIKLEPLINPNNDYFGVQGKKYNPKDMFSWAENWEPQSVNGVRYEEINDDLLAEALISTAMMPALMTNASRSIWGKLSAPRLKVFDLFPSTVRKVPMSVARTLSVG